MASPARRLALRVVSDVEQGGAVLSDRLAAADVEELDPRERGFLHELVLGTFRQRGLLDHALAPLIDRPLAQVDAPVRDVLRLGAYQILRLRVPHHAAVSESVELAASASPRARGFVNAVLRRLTRDGLPPVPDRVQDPRGWLLTEGSLPPWLADRWLARLGPELACRRAEAVSRPPTIACRLNPRVTDAEKRLADAGVQLAPLTVPGAFAVMEGAPGPLAREGVLYLQDEGSQLIGHLAAGPGRRLDACAAPGGKSALMADLGGGAIIAVELAPRRLQSLATLMRRWGAANVYAVGADARRPPFAGGFAGALLDAPCSGLGTLARHPDVRWRTWPKEIVRHAARQRELLAAVAAQVSPGGSLVYATCSLEPEENEGVLAPFLAAHPHVREAPVPGWAAPFRDGNILRTRPEVEGGDGFFVAPLVVGS